jgi:drug/metabolite transporter (DMT)-like permease
VIAVLGGLGAAVSWAGAMLCASRATRMIGPWSSLAWVMLVGLAVVAPIALVGGVPDELGAEELVWLLLAGAGNVVGLLFSYTALRIGKVSIIGPISSTEGAIAAVIAILAGEAIGPGVGVTLAVVVVGVALAGVTAGEAPESSHPLRATALAGAAAVCFGVGLYATARVSDSLPLVWALVPARVLGVLAVALPLAASRRIRITRATVPLLVCSGLCEVIGFASFAVGSRHGIAVAAVLASQFAAVAAVAAYFLFHERLTRVQLTGVVAIAVGVATITALQAS